MSDRWRGVVAALLNPDLRAALAELPQAGPLTDVRRARALERLEALGLVQSGDEGSVFATEALRAMLAETAPIPRTGPQRFLDGSGRIDRYPASAADRRELLRWVSAQVLDPAEVLSETQLNERLAPLTDDVAVLRRYLVDHGIVERTRSGSEYARARPGG